MIILGIHPGYHDAAACLFDDYQMIAAVALERLTRRKIDGGRVPFEAVEECLTIAGIPITQIDAVVLGRGAFPWSYYNHFRGGRLIEGKVRLAIGKEKHKSMERECVRSSTSDSLSIFRSEIFLSELGARSDVSVSFYNHHLAHALPTLFHTDWDEALLYTADGGGDNVQYSHRLYKHGQLKTLYGGDEGLRSPMRIDSLGLAYGFVTQALGWRINRHEGKLTGLAAFGEPLAFDVMAKHFTVNEQGQILSDFKSNVEMRQLFFNLAKQHSKQNMAASVQKLLEKFILRSVRQLLELYPVRQLGLAGGVFANVTLNRILSDEADLDEVFIYPAMGDHGLPAGGVLQYLLERDGLDVWLSNRSSLDDLYFGRDWNANGDEAFENDSRIMAVSKSPIEYSAKLIASGKVIAIYTKGMEYGPRALGARSILASPSDAKINDILNKRLGRSEFMPFAPVVAEKDANKVFDLDKTKQYAARFMTITCDVRADWRQKIPAVVHIDGTARPQILKRAVNPLYYDILEAHKKNTGLPVLINTSFNVHEEPIINSPEECIQAVLDNRIDYFVTSRAVYGTVK